MDDLVAYLQQERDRATSVSDLHASAYHLETMRLLMRAQRPVAWRLVTPLTRDTPGAGIVYTDLDQALNDAIDFGGKVQPLAVVEN